MSVKGIAVIPARGGSKRIKRKNIRLFAGQPLIAYSIQAARQTKVFTDIVVSTDDADIAHVARECGATVVIERPASLADDYTGTSPVVRHAITDYQNAFPSPDFVCCIYATAPFLSAEKLSEGLTLLSQNRAAKFAFSVTTFDFPIQRALKLSGSGVTPASPEFIGKRSQDLEARYHDAGQFYWGTTHAWLEKQAMFKEHSLPIVLPRYLVQDIDTEEDWIRAELMYKAYVTPVQ